MSEPAPTAEPKISDLAVAALEQGGWDRAAARAILKATLPPELVDKIVSRAVDAAVANAIGQAAINERRRSWQRTAHADAKGTVFTLARAQARQLLDMPLPNGGVLRNATRSHCSEAAELFAKQAADMGHKATFLHAVANHLPGDDTVGDRLTEDRLREIQTSVLATPNDD